MRLEQTLDDSHKYHKHDASGFRRILLLTASVEALAQLVYPRRFIKSVAPVPAVTRAVICHGDAERAGRAVS